MAKLNRRSPSQLGCGFITACGAVIVMLLVVNMTFVKLFFSVNLTIVDDRVFQAAQFVLPIVLIAIELWIYDQIFNRKKMPGNDE